MPERSKGLVSKTSVHSCTQGSNPCPSAKQESRMEFKNIKVEDNIQELECPSCGHQFKTDCTTEENLRYDHVLRRLVPACPYCAFCNIPEEDLE